MEEDEIKECIVKIKTNASHGTGFFIDTNKILTCSHVIKNIIESDIKIVFKGQEYSVKILDNNEEFEVDLAILKVDVGNDKFIPINSTILDAHKLKSYGFAESKDYFYDAPKSFDRGLVPVTLDYEGNDDHFMKFKNGQVEEGHSGSPIINLMTKAVCGILNASRNTDNNLGGYGIPIDNLKLFEGVGTPKPIKVKPKTILFNNYTAKNEPYYLKREEDAQFIRTLELSNIWIFGKSGKGKTALIQRNLIQEKIEYVFCDLSAITIKSTENIFDDIIVTIEEKFEILKAKGENNRVKVIVKLLEDIGLNKIIIVIDEMSVDNNTLLKEIASCFVKLVTHYTNTHGDESLKFVISTKAKPEEIILDKAKASNYFEYICCDNWEGYLSSLFDLFNNELGLNLVEDTKNYILSKADSSPRILNKIFLKIIICENLNDEKIENIVKLAVEESI